MPQTQCTFYACSWNDCQPTDKEDPQMWMEFKYIFGTGIFYAHSMGLHVSGRSMLEHTSTMKKRISREQN